MIRITDKDTAFSYVCMLKRELALGQHWLSEYDLVFTLPLSVLRSDGISDCAFREVLRRAVCRLNRGTGGDREVHRDLCRQHRHRAHDKCDARLCRTDVLFAHLCRLVECLLQFLAFYPGTLDVALLVWGLVLDARCDAATQDESNHCLVHVSCMMSLNQSSFPRQKLRTSVQW